MKFKIKKLFLPPTIGAILQLAALAFINYEAIRVGNGPGSLYIWIWPFIISIVAWLIMTTQTVKIIKKGKY